MIYEKQNFEDGLTLFAEQLNYIEDGIVRLFDEVETLKGGDLIDFELSAKTVSCYPVAGTAINAISKIVSTDGETGYNQVVLTHNNKNLLTIQRPSVAEGITVNITSMSGGNITGVGDSSTFINITPHIMRSTVVSLSVVMPSGMTFVYTKNGAWAGQITSSGSVTLMGSLGDTIGGYFTVLKNVTVNGEFSGQLEMNASATDYVAANTTIYTVDLPITVLNGNYDWETGILTDDGTGQTYNLQAVTLSAISGQNTIWSNTGNTTVQGTILLESDNGENTGIGEPAFDCNGWGLPVLELTGDTMEMSKDNAVDMEYTYDGRTGTCTVKWQGSSSVAYPKKNYTIKFDNAFEAADGWGEQKKYCMKANFIDHSHARNIVNAKLWGQIVNSRSIVPTELSSLPNFGAVDGFPIIIKMNGEFHGLYTFNIPKDGWMFGMGNGTQEAIVCADAWVDSTGFKAPATLDGDFELEYATDEDNAEWVATSLNQLINACINSDGSDLDTTIAQYIDWQSVIDYYIFSVLIEGADMTQKNYILATFDGTKWYMSAYDMDCTYGLYWDGSQWLPVNNLPSFINYAESHKLMHLVKTYKKDELKERYEELRNSVMSEDNITTIFSNFAGTIPSPVYMQDAKTWKTIPNSSTNNIAQILNYYRLRVALADKWMEKL